MMSSGGGGFLSLILGPELLNGRAFGREGVDAIFGLTEFVGFGALMKLVTNGFAVLVHLEDEWGS